MGDRWENTQHQTEGQLALRGIILAAFSAASLASLGDTLV